MKPCKSLCESASSSGSTCGGFLEAIGVNMTCSNTDIYSQEADSGSCNYLSSHTGIQVVSDRVETYNGTLCTGIVDQVYMLDPNKTKGVVGLPDLLPPGEHQKILESTLAAFHSIPRWLKSDCLTSMRKAFCSITFLEPVAKSDLVPYGFGTTYMPRFPEYGICTNYLKKCADPLVDFFSEKEALHLNCNMTVTDTKGLVRVFPHSTQVVAAVALSSTTTVYMTSEPSNTSASASFAIGSQCPYGFEDIDLTPGEEQPYTVNMLSSTGSPTSTDCVYQCPVKIFSDEDRQTIYNWNGPLLWYTVILMLIAFANVVILWVKKGDNPLMHTFIAPPVMIFVMKFTSLILYYDNYDPVAHVCSGETTWYRLETVHADWTGSAGASCATEAFTAYLVFMTILDCILMVVIELHLRAIHKYSNSDIATAKPYLRAASLFMHYFPLFLAFCITGQFVADEDAPTYFGITSMWSHGDLCTFSTGNGAADLMLLMFPVIMSYVIATAVSLYTLGACIIISYRALKMQDENPLWALWKTYKFLIITNIAYIYFFSYLVFADVLMYTPGSSINFLANFAAYKASIQDYYGCIIKGFSSLDADPTGGAARCSIDEINRLAPPVNTVIWIGMGIIVNAWSTMATWSEHAAAVYWQLLPAPVQDTINKVMDTFKSIKVLPINDAAEKANPDDMEMAKLKLKAKGSPDAEETKATEAL